MALLQGVQQHHCRDLVLLCEKLILCYDEPERLEEAKTFAGKLSEDMPCFADIGFADLSVDATNDPDIEGFVAWRNVACKRFGGLKDIATQLVAGGPLEWDQGILLEFRNIVESLPDKLRDLPAVGEFIEKTVDLMSLKYINSIESNFPSVLATVSKAIVAGDLFPNVPGIAYTGAVSEDVFRLAEMFSKSIAYLHTTGGYVSFDGDEVSVLAASCAPRIFAVLRDMDTVQGESPAQIAKLQAGLQTVQAMETCSWKHIR